MAIAKDDYEYVLTYNVKRAWKREIEEVIDVREGGPCLLGFEKGHEVLVYACITFPCHSTPFNRSVSLTGFSAISG